MATAAVAGAACPNPPTPLQATLKFQGGPANATFAPGAPIQLVVQVANCSGAEVLTTDGFSSTDFYRFLRFTSSAGRVINTSGAPLHHVNTTLFCHSRQGVLQSPTIPVVPVERLAPSFFREFAFDIGQFYDVSRPGLYSVTLNTDLLTFDASGPSAVFADCDQFQGPPPVTLVRVADISGRHSFTVLSNTLQFVVAGPGNPGPLDHIAITPADSSIGSGGAEIYSVQGFDAANNSLGDVTATTAFAISPNGSCSGPVCTATSLGVHTVTATNAGKHATATLTVGTATNVVAVWVGLANTDDTGIRFDLQAIVSKNGSQVGTGQLGSVTAAGSIDFNKATLHKIPIFSALGPVGPGDVLSVEVLVRNACARSGKNVGAARLWYNGAKVDAGASRDAGSRLDPAGAGPTVDFLRSGFTLAPLPGAARASIDKPAGPKCGPYQSFGIWRTGTP
jgi:hypothetical protein